jgi:hypothetical protein
MGTQFTDVFIHLPSPDTLLCSLVSSVGDP